MATFAFPAFLGGENIGAARFEKANDGATASPAEHAPQRCTNCLLDIVELITVKF